MIHIQSYWHDPHETIVSEEDIVALLSAQKQGIYLFDGVTNCGKSRILRSLKRCRKDMQVFSYVDITELIVAFCKKDISQSVAKRLSVVLSAFDCVAIEDIDFLYGKTSTLEIIAESLEALASNHLIIINGNALEQLVPEICCIEDVQYYRVCR